MQTRLCLYLHAVLAALLLLASPAQSAQVRVLEVSGVIGPATSDYIQRGLENADHARAALVVLTLDTPGGLDKSMRDLVQAIIASPVPVAVYVYPSGARAASAGTFILYSSHIAAMAPATNLGAASPVTIGAPGLPAPARPNDSDKGDKASAPASPASTMERKITNDAVAYIRSLAELRGRDADWAELAVREAASLSAQAALERGVIDLIATDVNHLLEQLHGREVSTAAGPRVLDTQALERFDVERDWRTEFLAIITNPNVAYLLMLAGIYGLLIEFYNPGVGLPGVVGAISLFLALYAFQMLPVSYAGLALMLLGLALMVAEALSPSFGVLGMGGLVAFAFGSILLMDTELPAYQIAWPVIAAFTALSGLLCCLVLAMALRARRQTVVSGTGALVGRRAQVLETTQTGYRVRVEGEIWTAACDQPLQPGDLALVVAVTGLRLTLVPDDTPSPAPSPGAPPDSRP